MLQTDRGVELGEVLLAVEGTPVAHAGGPAESSNRSEGDDFSPAIADGASRVLRIAGPDDLLRSRHAAESRLDHFSLCQRILEQANWPWEVVDVEPLLDGRSTVIHYLGPHRIDIATLRARFRTECDLDVVLEPVGTDLDTEYSTDAAHERAKRWWRMWIVRRRWRLRVRAGFGTRRPRPASTRPRDERCGSKNGDIPDVPRAGSAACSPIASEPLPEPQVLGQVRTRKLPNSVDLRKLSRSGRAVFRRVGTAHRG